MNKFISRTEGEGQIYTIYLYNFVISYLLKVEKTKFIRFHTRDSEHFNSSQGGTVQTRTAKVGPSRTFKCTPVVRDDSKREVMIEIL